MRCEERFYVKLSTGLLFAKALDVDASCHGRIFENFLHFMNRFVFYVLRQRHFSLNAGVVFNNIEDRAVSQCGYDSGEGLKVAHTFKGMNDADWHGQVLVAIDFAEEEVIHRKI